jgi:putative addiction module component (TIGR02574 family)
MILDSFPELHQLTTAEKMLLANELWEEVADDPAEIPLTREQVATLDERMAHYRAHPEEVTTWEEIKARLQKTKSGGK